MTDTAGRLKAALLDPAAVFRAPDQVEHDPTLSREDKLAILKNWEKDARELAVAEEESMTGGEPNRLDEVVAARIRLEDEATSAGHKEEEPAEDPSPLHVRHFTRPVHEVIHADHDIDEAALELSLQERAILPVSDGDEIIGVVARADLARATETTGTQRLSARDIMTSEIALCYLDDPVTIARALMDRHACNHLLVIDSERALAGILARGDLPPVSQAETQSVHDRPDILNSREENPQGLASTAQPGGLKVYAQRPTIRKTPPSS